MKRLPSLLLSGALALLAGCVKMEEVLTLKADGGGTLELKYSVAEETISRIEAMRRLAADLEAAAGQKPPAPTACDYSRLLLNPRQADIESKLKEFEAFGVNTERLEVKTRDARRQVEIRVRFGSLAELAKTDFFQSYGFSLTRRKDGKYRLYREAHVKTPLPKNDDPEVIKTMTPMLEGFNVLLTLHTPGRVVSANAPVRSSYSVTWRYDFDRNPNALAALENQEFEVVFEEEESRLPDIKRGGEPPPPVVPAPQA